MVAGNGEVTAVRSVINQRKRVDIAMSRLGKIARNIKIKRLYREYGFIDAYRRHTDIRVKENPRTAIGGRWDEMGEMQLAFLRAKGLLPGNTLLDLGCGTLRAGRHLIPYLDTGKYTGVDISPEAIGFARRLVSEEGLSDKNPELILNTDGDMRFDNLPHRFDYIIAQSVFTHLPESFIHECFANLGRILDGTFYFTIHAGERSRVAEKTFQYPVRWVREIVESHGWKFEDCSGQYIHPGNQVMLSASVAEQRRPLSPAGLPGERREP